MDLTAEQRERVTAFINPNIDAVVNEENLNQLVIDVKGKKLALEIIVRNLGDALTSMDDLVRARGVLLIGEILKRVPNMNLTKENASTFAQFLTVRLLDFPCVPQVIQAIHALITHHELCYEKAADTNPDFVVTSIFNELHIPSLRQSVRKHIYEILNTLLCRYPHAMERINRDFVVGVIQAVDMEKDPRNLLVSFDLIQSVVKHLPVFAEFGEEMFEVISCYYPVSFRTTSSDPSEITKNDLEKSLLETLTCTIKFAPFCIPFLLDKINDTAPDEKVEIFQTLAECIHRFHTSVHYTVHTHPFQKEFGAIWSIYRNELTSPFDTDFHRDCLNTLVQITKTLAVDVVPMASGDSFLDQFLEPIIRDCVHQMASPDVALASRNAFILSTCGCSARYSCKKILIAAIPFAAQSYLVVDSPADGLQALRTTNRFINAANQNQEIWKDHDILDLLVKHKKMLFPHLYEVLRSEHASSLYKAAVAQSLQYFSVIPDVMCKEELDTAVSELGAILLKPTPPEMDRSAQRGCIQALVVLQNRNPEKIASHTIPSLFAVLHDLSLGDGTPVLNEDGEETQSAHALHCILRLSPVLHKETLSSLFAILQNSEKSTCLSKSSILKEIHDFIVEGAEELQEWNESEIIPQCLQFAFFAAEKNIDNHTKLIQLASTVIGDIFLVSVHQDKLLAAYTPLFFQSSPDQSITSTLLPFSSTWSREQAELVCMVGSFIIPCKSQILANFMSGAGSPLLLPIMESLIHLSNGPHDLPPMYVDIIGSIVNKVTANESLTSTIQTLILSQLDGLLENSNFEEKKLKVLLYTVKSLCLRSDKLAWKSVQSICRVLQATSSKELASVLVNGLKKILDEKQEKEWNFLVKGMYKQRFYHECKKLLFDPKLKATEISSFALMALSIVSQLPEPLMKRELPLIFPAIHQSLHSSDADLILSSLESMKTLAVSAQSTLLSHISSLISLMIKLAAFPSSIKVREQALSLLEVFSTFPFQAIYPNQRKVIKELLPMLDDRKRIVRKAASRCRNEWMVLADV